MTALVNFVLITITSDPRQSPLRTTRPSHSSPQHRCIAPCQGSSAQQLDLMEYLSGCGKNMLRSSPLWQRCSGTNQRLINHGLHCKRWKEANINPLAKVDIPSEYADYRGTNVTPVIARAFERTVYCTFNKNCLENFISGTLSLRTDQVAVA